MEPLSTSLHQLIQARAAVHGILEHSSVDDLAQLHLEELQEVVECGLSQERVDDLLLALVQNDRPLEQIDYLVRCGANVYRMGPDGTTLLMEATRSASLATVEYLLSQGLNPRARDDRGRTAMHFAWSRRDVRTSLLPFERKEAFMLSTAALTTVGIFYSCIAPIAAVFWNVLTNAMMEHPERESRALYCYQEAGISWAFANYAFDGGLSWVVFLIYAVSSISFGMKGCFKNETVQTLLIDYISPMVKVANLVSAIAMLVLGDVIFGGVIFTLYTISLLDKYGYLPVSIQRVFYNALYVCVTLPAGMLMNICF